MPWASAAAPTLGAADASKALAAGPQKPPPITILRTDTTTSSLFQAPWLNPRDAAQPGITTGREPERHAPRPAPRPHLQGFGARLEPDDSQVTPAAWLVLWLSVAAGFLMGYGFNGNPLLLYSHSYRNYFKLREPSELINTPELTTSPRQASAWLWQVQTSSCHSNLPYWEYNQMVNGVSAAFVLGSGHISTAYGRRATFVIATTLYIIGQTLQATAVIYPMILTGRAIAVIAATMLAQVSLLQAVEVAPKRMRGAWICCLTLGRAVGWGAAGSIQYGLETLAPWGWRVCLAFGAWPAVLLLVLLVFLPETPHSLIQRGQLEAGREALQAFRGAFHAVDREFDQILAAAHLTDAPQRPWVQFRAVFERRRLPALLTTTLLLVARVMTDMWLVTMSSVIAAALEPNGIMLEEPLQSMVLAAAQTIGVTICLLTIDRVGRVPFIVVGAAGSGLITFAQAGLVSSLGHAAWQVAMPVLMAIQMMIHAPGLDCALWASATELHGLATRSAALALMMSVYLVLYSLRNLANVATLCKNGAMVPMLVHASVSLAVAVLLKLLVPETKNLPLEAIGSLVWAKNRFWKRLV